LAVALTAFAFVAVPRAGLAAAFFAAGFFVAALAIRKFSYVNPHQQTVVTHTRKIDARRQSADCTLRFKQYASGPLY
jgi:hypothetical protein